MPGDLEQPLENSGEEAEQPLILVPVDAEDISRRRRRILTTCGVAALIALGTAGFLYKRSMDPIHAQESYDAGVRLLKIARYSQAILSFDRAVGLKPDFPDAYLMRARAYVGDGRTVPAITDFTRVIKMRPNDPQPLLERGRAYMDKKDYQAAIDDATRALAMDSNLAAAYNLRGTAVRTMGNLRGALQDFDRSVKLEPKELNYFERGITYQMMGEHQLAIADFSEVIAFAPDEAAGYFSRAKSKREIGDFRGAEEDHLQGRIIDGR